MGKSERRALFRHLRDLLMHLLKWQYQEKRHSASWKLSIRNARDEIQLILDDSPSLNNTAAENLSSAYRKARANAVVETGLGERILPEQCPYSLEQVLDEEFFPDE